jgi:hypothetical protein
MNSMDASQVIGRAVVIGLDVPAHECDVDR